MNSYLVGDDVCADENEFQFLRSFW